jgi:hypothetical protein
MQWVKKKKNPQVVVEGKGLCMICMVELTKMGNRQIRYNNHEDSAWKRQPHEDEQN